MSAFRRETNFGPPPGEVTRPPATSSDRVAAWFLTGPVGRVVAFAADLGAALGTGALNKLSRR